MTPELLEPQGLRRLGLNRSFQTQVGISYREYMTRLKIERGQYLLRRGLVRPEELASTLGYRDREYFAGLFLQRTGQTVQEYARREEWSAWSI